MLKKIKNANPIIYILLSNALITSYFLWIRPKYNQANANNASAIHATNVTVITAKKQSVELVTELPGRVSSYRISEVRPRVDGVIKKRKFTEGSFIKEGTQLYQIDPTVYQTAYDNANANYKTLRAKRDRYKILIEQDAVSKQEFDDVSAAFASAQADLKNAKTNLTYTKVLAPISGYIGKSNITEGTLVTTNQAEVLTTITELDPIYIDMAQPTKDALKLDNKEELDVSVTTDDPTYKNTGKLKLSEVFADESTDSVRLRALFSNPEKKLIPGMFVNGTIHLKPFDAITIPQRATNRAPDGNLSVWVVEKDNIAKPRSIKAEQIYKDSWIVTDGLNEGDIIIYEGFLKLADGAKVNPTPLAASTTPTNSVEKK